MNFEEILANCLDALERGETIESCLARYPQNATELAPLLHLATTVRSAPQPRLSAEAFQRGRDAVRAQAQYHHSLHAPFAAARAKPAQKTVVQHAQPTTPSLPSRQAHARKPVILKPFILIYRTTGAFSALVLLLCLLTLMRNIIISLPGTTLYPIKILSENMEGVLLTAAGEQVTWHARQTENRLQELVLLTQQQQTATDDLLQTIEANVQATLAASNKLPAAQRDQFLLTWREHLQTIQTDKNLPPTVAFTLEKALATVKSATQITVAPAKLPAARTPTARPGKASTPILVPTALPSTAPSGVVQQAPAEVTTNGPGLTPIEVTPLPLPTPVIEKPVVIAPTPTAAQVVIQMPKENSPSADDQNNQSRHTAKAPAEPTTDPVIAAVATQTTNSASINSAATNSVANSTGTKTNDVKASRAMTTSVASAPDAATKSNDDSKSASNQPAATAALAAPPALVDTPTNALVSAPEKNDTPSPLASTTPAPNTPGDDKTPDTSTQMPDATASATSSSKQTPTPKPKKTPTPEKAVEPTEQPTDPPEATATPAADDEQTEDTPTSQPTAEAMNTPSSGNHKQPGKK